MADADSDPTQAQAKGCRIAFFVLGGLTLFFVIVIACAALFPDSPAEGPDPQAPPEVTPDYPEQTIAAHRSAVALEFQQLTTKLTSLMADVCSPDLWDIVAYYDERAASLVSGFHYQVQHDEEFRARYTEEQEKVNEELRTMVFELEKVCLN